MALEAMVGANGLRECWRPPAVLVQDGRYQVRVRSPARRLHGPQLGEGLLAGGGGEEGVYCQGSHHYELPGQPHPFLPGPV
eukprot:882081-Lingulodinium_polyedra.AAC.1